jgi:single-stranded-DNA-specific exonuclease
LQENRWNGETRIELEIVGMRLPSEAAAVKKASFSYRGRSYTCSFGESIKELRIRNERGQVLAVSQGQTVGLLGINRETAQEVDITQPHFSQLIAAARSALGKP